MLRLRAAEVSGPPVFSSVCQNLSLRRLQIQRDTSMSHIPVGSAPPSHPPTRLHSYHSISLVASHSVTHAASPLPDALNRAPLFSCSTEDRSLVDAESVTCKFMSRRGKDAPDSCGGGGGCEVRDGLGVAHCRFGRTLLIVVEKWTGLYTNKQN